MYQAHDFLSLIFFLHSTDPVGRRGRATKRLLNKHRNTIWRLRRHLQGKFQAKCTRCQKPDKIIENASKYLDARTLQFFTSQMKASRCKKKGNRYTIAEKSFSLALYYKSPKAYRFLSSLFSLPAVRSLQLWLRKKSFQAGWNDSVFNLLKNSVQKMKAEERVCGITFDAMHIKQTLQYDQCNDCVEGMEDLGQHGKSSKPANYAMVFMLKGLVKKWKQTLGYFFMVAA